MILALQSSVNLGLSEAGAGLTTRCAPLKWQKPIRNED
ncbi:uncharacterized protein METZ01_LOCUS27059 [marine metagenome]|uniref:Uncharacterized protein n=1 Tax=marine metagenome TaxID=408172 RepID=A0A381Q4F2_9ZZZZ